MNKKKKGTGARLMEFAGSHKWGYIFSILFAILSVAGGFVPYIFMADLVRRLLSGTATLSDSLMSCLYIALFFVAGKVLHIISTGMSHKATFEVLGGIRRLVTKKLAMMPLGDVLSKSSGTYKNIIVERIDSIETTLAHLVPEFTSNAILPIAVFIYMMSIDWRLTLIALIPLPVGFVFFCLMFVGGNKSYENTVTKTKILNDTAVEYINGIEVIKAFGKEKTSYDKFVVAVKEGADCFIDWMRRCNVRQNCAMTLMPAQLLTLIPFGAWFVMSGRTSGADLFILIILAMGLITPFITIATYADDLAKIGTIIGEVANILDNRELVRPDTLKKKPQGSTVTLENVHFGYNDEEILHGVNMVIKEGTVNALVGPSGAGKSTIAKLIASFWDVDGGAIRYGGVDVKDIPLETYNNCIAYVSQDNYLFDETVMENIRLGNPSASDEEVINAAKACGCHDFIMNLEKGYKTICGGAGSHLSGGERQRISIARAMLKNAPIVILDEATAYTDPENEAVIQRSVAGLVKGKTLIVIAHRLSTIVGADKIFLINNGTVEACGTQDELLASSPLYRQMWKSHESVRETV